MPAGSIGELKLFFIPVIRLHVSAKKPEYLNQISGSRFRMISTISAARDGFPFRVISCTPPQFSTMLQAIRRSHAGFPHP